MCQENPGFTTIVGAHEAMDRLVEEWDGLETVERARLPLTRPRVLDDSYRTMRHVSPVAIAVVWHTEVRDPIVAHMLQAEMVVRQLPLLCEPGFELQTAAGPSTGGGAVTVTLDKTTPGNATTSPLSSKASGRRVAVLDTGQQSNSKNTMIDFLNGLVDISATPDDANGHGTAVAKLIEAINPKADITPLRVVSSSTTKSYELLCGMVYALASGEFDVINVSLATELAPGCMTVLGSSLELARRQCAATAKFTDPVIVAAAGNKNQHQAFSYPAKLAGSVIVQAWDSNNTSATYNIGLPATLPPKSQVVYATGGDSVMSFGTITRTGTGPEQMVGTSFAAAVVTANLIP
jgi:Subtilase family